MAKTNKPNSSKTNKPEEKKPSDNKEVIAKHYTIQNNLKNPVELAHIKLKPEESVVISADDFNNIFVQRGLKLKLIALVKD